MTAVKKFVEETPAFCAKEDAAAAVVCLLACAAAAKDDDYGESLVDQALVALNNCLADGARPNDLQFIANQFEVCQDLSPSARAQLVAALRATSAYAVPAAFLPGVVAAVLEGRRRRAIAKLLEMAAVDLASSLEWIKDALSAPKKKARR